MLKLAFLMISLGIKGKTIIIFLSGLYILFADRTLLCFLFNTSFKVEVVS